MTTKLCTHVYPTIAIAIAMAILHVRNQWQLASFNEYIFYLTALLYKGNIPMTIDLRTLVESTTTVAMAMVKNTR